VFGLNPLPPADLEKGKIVFDFDTDGCLASSPVEKLSNSFIQNNGTKNSGALDGQCAYRDQLSRANILYKEQCTQYQGSTYCARIFELYTVKDQVVAGSDAFGHRHDLEEAIVWMKDGIPTHIGVSAHGNITNTVVSKAPRALAYGSNAYAVVYHKDGGATHTIRLAKSKVENGLTVVNESPENPTGQWVLPNLVDVSQAPTAYQNILFSADYGKASLKMAPHRIIDFLNSKKPSEWNGVQFY